MIYNNITQEETSGKLGTKIVRIGFIPLLDSAVLAVAAEFGFAQSQGIELRLAKEVSWANIRDKIMSGHLDGAQMLAPMPVASSLGIGHVKVPMTVPFSFGSGGNTITVSHTLFNEMNNIADFNFDDALKTGYALKKVISQRMLEGKEPLIFGMVFPFSNQNYELRYWMAASGIDPDKDVRLVVIPPALMGDSLKHGHIHGFCVGEPWSSVSVLEQDSHIISTRSHILRHTSEKVLGIRREWANTNQEPLRALIRALHSAAKWADDPNNLQEISELLASKRFLDMSAGLLKDVLEGKLHIDSKGTKRHIEDFFVFHEHNKTAPSQDHALWLYSQMIRWGQATYDEEAVQEIARIMRRDIYDAAVANHEGHATNQFENISLVDECSFDKSNLQAYVESLPIKSVQISTQGS